MRCPYPTLCCIVVTRKRFCWLLIRSSLSVITSCPPGSPTPYLGAYLEKREKDHAIRRYVKQLERLGHQVSVEPAAELVRILIMEPTAGAQKLQGKRCVLYTL